MKNKILTLLLSLAISFGLWLYVVTVINPEYETTIYNVPVELVGSGYLDAKNMILVSPSDDIRVNLTLRGNRSDVKKITSSNVTVIADLVQINQPGVHELSCSVSFQSGTAEVLAQDPASISVEVVMKSTASVDVKPKFVGTVPNGYEADPSVDMDHTTVKISGPKETIEKIAYAEIAVDLTGKMATFKDHYPLTLCGSNGLPITDDSYVTVYLDEIQAVVQIYQVKRVPVVFDVKYENSGLDESMITVQSPVKTVTLIGNGTDLQKVDDVLVIPIYLDQYSQTFTETFAPDLPQGVVCKEAIMVQVTMPEMDTRVFTVNVEQFEPINVPAGLTVRVTESAEVTVRGSLADLEKISVEDILGKVDCSNITVSSGYAPVAYTVKGYEYLYADGNWEHAFIEVEQTE